jgi:hypothetical protein
MKATVILIGPYDSSSFILGTGAMTSRFIAWADVFTGDGLVTMVLDMRSQTARPRPVLDTAPVLDAVDNTSTGILQLSFGIPSPTQAGPVLTGSPCRPPPTTRHELFLRPGPPATVSRRTTRLLTSRTGPVLEFDPADPTPAIDDRAG